MYFAIGKTADNIISTCTELRKGVITACQETDLSKFVHRIIVMKICGRSWQLCGAFATEADSLLH